ncbi:MAG TPA: hypothetical protein VFN80_06215 [Acidothermaceae bacterium]|nr:hypothetical protein [Acidothermaceae bacterium]
MRLKFPGHFRLRRAMPTTTLVVAAAMVLSACTSGRHHAATQSQPGDTGTQSAASGAGGGSAKPSIPPSATAPTPELTATTLGARLPQPLSRVVAVDLGGKVQIIGGLTASQQTTANIETFDPSTGGVTAAGKLAAPVHDAAAGVINGAGIVAGGGAASTTNAVQQVRSDGTAARLGQLPQPRSDDSVAVNGKTLYVVGGYDGVHEVPAVLATTDGVTYTQVGQLAETIRYGAAYAANGSVWMFGGEHQGVTTADIQRVDTATGKTSVVAKFPHPLAHEAVATLGDQVLVIGGTDGHTLQNTVYRFEPSTNALTVVGSLPESVSDMAAVVVGDTAYVIGGNALTAEQTVAATTTIVALKVQTVSPSSSAQGAGAKAFTGQLLIADRGNNRLLLVDPKGAIHWTFPNAHAAAPPSGFYFPDDAFFTDGGKAIISNQEGNHTIVKIAYPAGNSLWSYGHPGQAGPGSGYLHEPDDAYLLKDGRVIVADANNCRVVIISQQAQQIGQIGTTGSCVHRPPKSLGYPNGDTPLQNGDVLISEVDGSWISEYTLTGSLVWTVHVPITYPSDPQQIGPDKYIVADYARPGGIVEFDREGHVLWDYHVPSGHNMLDHPSLAEVLPSGLICVNDDYRHRVVMIDPATKSIVWQYGVDDVSGTAPGLLNTPDGFDLLAPDGTTPTHPWTG